MFGVIIVMGLAILLLVLYFSGYFNIINRKKLTALPFPNEWKAILKQNVPIYSILPETFKDELHKNIQIFIGEKRFEGCAGFEITDEVKVTISGQASILLLNRPSTYYKKLSAILVYPDTYMARESNMFKSQQDDTAVAVEGQSYDQGIVILAWSHVIRGSLNEKDGQNVVFHEFAHQLDQEDGSTDGMPAMSDRSKMCPWISIVGDEFEQFKEHISKGHKQVMDSYGATNSAEFFAVATETFFEKPKQLFQKYPELYGEFKGYYKLDPKEWV